MRYVIMSGNTLEGFQMRHFQSLDGLFFAGAEKDGGGYCCKWVEAIGDAETFDTEADAWQTCTNIWGRVSLRHMVVAIPDSDFHEAIENAPEVNKVREQERLERIEAERSRIFSH